MQCQLMLEFSLTPNIAVCEILAQEQELFGHAEGFRTCAINILGIVQNVLVYILYGIGVLVWD